MNPFNNKFLRAIRTTALMLLASFVLVSCGGGGGGGGNNSGGNNAPSQVALVEVSSAGSSSIDVSWLPAVDCTTLASSMKYQVHASTELIYTPSSTTLKAEGTGILSVRLTGLLAATRYTITLVAINASGQSTVSTPLTVTTSSLNSETIPGVVIATPTDIQVAAVTANQVTLTADAAVPQVGQLIASTQGDGFLRQVTQVSTVAGQTVVQTQPASLNQAVNNVEISSAFNMTSVPAEAAPVQAGIIVKPSTSQKGTTEWKWPQTNFRMSSAPVNRNTQAALQMGLVTGTGNMDVSTQTVSSVGSWATFKGPNTIGILTNTSGAVELNVDVIKDDTSWNGTRIPIAICKVEVISSDAPNLVTVSTMTPTATEMVGNYSAIRNATQLIAVDATNVAPRASPYLAVLRAYIDEAGNNCQGSYRFFLGWKEKLDIPINVAVVSTPNFPQAESKPLDFTGGFNVHNDVTFTFDPRLEAEVKLHNTGRIVPGIDYARLEAKSRAALKQKLTVTATGKATLDKTQTLITPRTFVKVYMAGTVPIVMSGEFAADLRIQGDVTGALVATEELTFSLEDMVYGVIYDDTLPVGQKWRTTQNVRPTYQLKLSGNGDAQAHLTLSLVPRLSIKFYEAATGRLVVSPYLQADAGIHGQVLADITPSGIITDADYWLTQGQIAGGIDAYLMADLTIWDKTFLKWPDTANIADYKSFHPVTLIPNTIIVGLPNLTATYDAVTKHPTDSRAYLIKGRAVDVANPLQSLYGGPASFLPFASWTKPKVIALNNTGYNFVSSPVGSDPGDVWVTFTAPGTYTVRLGGNSSMGGWARQVAEVIVDVTDSNSNGIIDQWETKYGLTGSGAVIAAADPDGDGMTNLQEFQQGSNPLVADAPPPVAPSQTVVITQVLDDFGASVGALAQGATTDDTTPTLSGTLSAALTATQTLRVFNGNTVLGAATVSGTTWSFTPTALASGNFSFTAAVVSVDGIEGVRSPVWNLTISGACPVGQVLQNGVCVTPPTTGTIFSRPYIGENITLGAVTDFYQYYFMGYANLANPPTSPNSWVATHDFNKVRLKRIGGTLTCSDLGFEPGRIYNSNAGGFESGAMLTGGTAVGEYCDFIIQLTTGISGTITKGTSTGRLFFPATSNGKTIVLDGSSANAGRSVNGYNTADRPGGFAFQFCMDTCTDPFVTPPPPTASTLNDTGITAMQCYQAGSDVLVDCASAGALALNSAQDGMVGRDANPATNSNADGKLGFSFTAVADGANPLGCVQDNVTGLMWENKTNDGGLRDWNKTYSNFDSTTSLQKPLGFGVSVAPTQAEIDASTNSVGFKNSVNAQGLCGYSDWRLPTVDELHSIMNYGVIIQDSAMSPAIDTAWFPNTFGFFWSSSPISSSSLGAWNVDFQIYNSVASDYVNRYTLGNHVRLVRAGQAPVPQRYTVSAGGKDVTDNQTNLIWRRCAEGMNWDGTTCVGTASTFSHEAALQQAASQASSTGMAWRLPNVNELFSIADKGRANPAIDPAAFPATPASLFLSATPSHPAYFNSPPFAWCVEFNYGWKLVCGNSSYARLVRSAP